MFWMNIRFHSGGSLSLRYSGLSAVALRAGMPPFPVRRNSRRRESPVRHLMASRAAAGALVALAMAKPSMLPWLKRPAGPLGSWVTPTQGWMKPVAEAPWRFMTMIARRLSMNSCGRLALEVLGPEGDLVAVDEVGHHLQAGQGLLAVQDARLCSLSRTSPPKA